MAYFEQHGSMHGWNDSGGYHPPAKVLRRICDTCFIAEFGEEAQGIHNRPDGWKWAPHYGCHCENCNTKC
jgi:hypothetical protein